MGQNHPPGANAGEEKQCRKGFDKGLLQVRNQFRGFRAERQRFVRVKQTEQASKQGDDAHHQQQIMAQSGFKIGNRRCGQDSTQRAVPLSGEIGARFAQIITARIE